MPAIASWQTDEAHLQVFAALLATKLRARDVICLDGDLGAGKSTLARALIRALLEDDEADVPSPTFPIVQVYDDARVPIAHFDWFRLAGGDELDELGFNELQDTHAILIEWTDRVPEARPPDSLTIQLSDVPGAPDQRAITLHAADDSSGLASRVSRVIALFNAVSAYAAANAQAIGAITYMTGDASARAYARVHFIDGTTRVLMDSPAETDGPPISDTQSYSQIARLAESIDPFVDMSRMLDARGLTIPRVAHVNREAGIALLDDLGNAPFDAIVRKDPTRLGDLWRHAVDTLVHLRTANDHHVDASPAHIFTNEILRTEARLLVDWAIPARTGKPAAAEALHAFEDALNALLATGICMDRSAEHGIMLRDFHSPNLMWLPEREGIARVGVIDFQDALRGPWAYDLVSLLQDARVDVSAERETELLAHYTEAVSQADAAFDADLFQRDYAILGAQRAAKIIGIFHRLNIRDGKPHYLAHIPRVERYMARNLAHPALAPLRAWVAEHLFPTGP